VAQVVEHLPSNCEVLSSNSSTGKKKKRGERGRERGREIYRERESAVLGLNSGLHAYYTGALLCEPSIQSFLEIGSCFLPRLWSSYFKFPAITVMTGMHYHAQLVFLLRWVLQAFFCLGWPETTILLISHNFFLPGMSWNHNPPDLSLSSN
jgi:hypothetical protein